MTVRRMVAGALVALVAGYASLCGLLYLKQTQLVYYPQYTRGDAAGTNFVLQRGPVQLRGFVVNPGQRDALLYFGGNAESLRPLQDDLGHWFPSRTVYLLPYRGYGGNPGTPSESELTTDALALFDDVRTRHRGGIGVIGRSLGSGVASFVAAHRPVERLALVTPFDSLANVARGHYPWVPVRWLMHDTYDSTSWLKGTRIPVLVVRAGRDEVVPPPRTDALLAALPQAQVLAVAEADHMNIGEDPRYAQALREFFGQGAAQATDSSR